MHKDVLKEYIKKSELRIFSESIKVRLSKELATQYDKGIYHNNLETIQKNWDKINSLTIQYPGNAHPILYVYIVPDENYIELLKFPKKYARGKGSGKPVPCYDLDGYNIAFGLSQSLLANNQENNISKTVNVLHELSHIVHSQFFQKNKTIHEGFAEVLPLYVLGLEEEFEEYKSMLKQLNENQILTVQQLLDSEKDGSYGDEVILPNKSCSFNLSYISSYLFVRGCLEKLAERYKLSLVQTIQFFLELVRNSPCINEFLICDIATELKIPPDELLNFKNMQLKILNKINKDYK